MNASPQPATTGGQIPKIIWILWLQGLEQAPPAGAAMRRLVEKYNPDWKIVVVDEQSMTQHASIPAAVMANCAKVSRQAVSEVLRVNLIAQHGGVWADATCLCCKPLDQWLPECTRSDFCLRQTRSRPLAFQLVHGSDQDCHIAKAYASMCNDHFTLNDRPLKSRITRRIAKIIERQCMRSPRVASWLVYPRAVKIFPVNPYFWFHYTFYRLVATDERSRQIWDATPKVSADGPHEMQRKAFNPITPEIKAIIESRRDPVYKLNWRKKDWPADSVLDYLLRSV